MRKLKNKNYVPILFLAVLFFIINCKKRDNEPDFLPEETQNGANTGGAIVDGKIWVASNKRVNGNHGGTYCEIYNNNANIEIELNNVSNQSRIFIKALIPNFELNKTYLLKRDTPDSDYNLAYYLDTDKNVYMTQPTSEYNGELKISRLDIKNQIVSGTFTFKARDYNDSKTINIIDGRFDRKFD